MREYGFVHFMVNIFISKSQVSSTRTSKHTFSLLLPSMDNKSIIKNDETPRRTLSADRSPTPRENKSRSVYQHPQRPPNDNGQAQQFEKYLIHQKSRPKYTQPNHLPEQHLKDLKTWSMRLTAAQRRRQEFTDILGFIPEREQTSTFPTCISSKTLKHLQFLSSNLQIHRQRELQQLQTKQTHQKRDFGTQTSEVSEWPSKVKKQDQPRSNEGRT